MRGPGNSHTAKSSDAYGAQYRPWSSDRGLFFESPMSSKRKSYIRDDGVVMVEIRPHVYVEESIAERLGLLR